MYDLYISLKTAKCIIYAAKFILDSYNNDIWIYWLSEC